MKNIWAKCPGTGTVTPKTALALTRCRLSGVVIYLTGIYLLDGESKIGTASKLV